MAKKSLENELESAIGNLRSERAQLLSRVSEIDASFARLGIKVDAVIATPAKRLGRPPAAASAKKPGPKPKSGGKRGSFAISGDESVLEFVKKAGQPNSAEINAHWTKEGRKGKADNSITKLVKTGKLTRVSVEGERGGRYKIA